ncbi:sulfite exporter TauE/SafE family protein [Sulfitobacter sp. D35]|uniref:sulfite exporter TauE/SafE family protein n=1 Tax=Sulfitobacter sp. D35 TaxID=3083252 RepID=UPI00296E6831|nr:sulfite exporter TauE/SafE family protein [Sulfitobacter sp. D35]MDW4499062.1 sulfite exporter TauE/SafE family protein [Sulfitobacter sp. D35]
MPVLDLSFLLIAGPAVLFAGISKGGFGSGAAFASSSLLALVIEPGLALGVMLPLLMLMDASTLRPYWRRWNAEAAWMLILGGLPGVALGAAFYAVASPDVLRVMIGTIALLFVAWRLALANGWISVVKRQVSRGVGLLAGVVAGFTSYVSHAGGPPAAVYLLARGMSKTEYQATTVLVFWAINIAKFLPYAWLGLFTAGTFRADLVLAPFALLGAWLGVRAHRMISERAFFAVTYILLGVTGVKLIWDGLT